MRGLARTTCLGGCGAEERDRVPCRGCVVEPAEFSDPVDREARAVAVAAETPSATTWAPRVRLQRPPGASSPLASSSSARPGCPRRYEPVRRRGRGLDSKSCPPGIWTICESRLGTPASAMTCTRPRSTDRGPPVRHACASSNENASGQKHVFAPLRPSSGASAPLTTPLRIRADGPAHAALHL